MSDKEKLAHWMMKRGYATGHGDTMEDLLRELAWQMDERIEKAVAKERERCIADCDSVDVIGAEDCIAAIRTRGEKND